MTVLIVGAGFAGVTYARTLADAGIPVVVIDRRDHVAGNAADSVDANGLRVHRYGPHLFHTKSATVVAWLERFGEWLPYRHKVGAWLPDGRLVPLPINLATIGAVFGVEFEDEAAARAFLARQAVPIADPQDAGAYLRSELGEVLTDLFFRPYTRKMWGMELEEMDQSVVKRLPIRFDRSEYYFPDAPYQMLPRDGYTALVANILAHPLIRVEVGTPFEPGMEHDYDFCFNSMAIDEYFGYALGELPYRSLRFHERTATEWDGHGCATRNYTDAGPYTRETWWHQLPGHLVRDTGRRTVTVEEPCDYRDNDRERYYPVRTSDGRYQELYRQYRRLAESNDRMGFIGRCGTYQYLDIDQVIAQSLTGARKWLDRR